MVNLSCSVVLIVTFVTSVETAKILCVFPIPQLSHQVAFRSLIRELLRRNHEVDVVTVDPSYPKGQTPPNLTEIDIHDVSYNIWTEKFIKSDKKGPVLSLLDNIFNLFTDIMKNQFASENFQNLIRNKKKYDILIADGIFSPPWLIASHIFKVPLLGLSTTTDVAPTVYEILGIPRHALNSPGTFQIKHNCSFLESYKAIYDDVKYYNIYKNHVSKTYEVLKMEIFPDLPELNELRKNVHAVLINSNVIWDGIIALPLNCARFQFASYPQLISEDIQSYLDSSKEAVIYASFGTSVLFSLLPAHTISVFFGVFARLPYQVLLKCDQDELPGRPENVKLFKWLPQSDVLKHPKIKLFITQGGQHSIDGAIEAGVPMIVIPNVFDQFANSERCVQHGIGAKVDLKTMTEENLMDAINNVVEDKRYRENIVKLHTLIQDTPMKSMDRLIWAIEYIIRHGGAQHMRSPSANLSWAEFFELELLCIFLSIVLVLFLIVVKLLLFVKRYVIRILWGRDQLYDKVD